MIRINHLTTVASKCECFVHAHKKKGAVRENKLLYYFLDAAYSSWVRCHGKIRIGKWWGEVGGESFRMHSQEGRELSAAGTAGTQRIRTSTKFVGTSSGQVKIDTFSTGISGVTIVFELLSISFTPRLDVQQVKEWELYVLRILRSKCVLIQHWSKDKTSSQIGARLFECLFVSKNI